jgi:hypothetical protein
MERKYSIITGFMGKVKDRFIDYHPAREMEEMVAMASKVKGCSGLEVVYPQNFVDPVKTKKLLDDYNLGVSTVNLNIKRAHFNPFIVKGYTSVFQRQIGNPSRRTLNYNITAFSD